MPILFHHKTQPSGEPFQSDDYRRGYEMSELHYREMIEWASSYISLLEKELEHRCDGCDKREHSGKNSDN